MGARTLPSQDLICRLLRYDSDTGKLFWRHRTAKMFKSSGRGGADANAKRWNALFAEQETFTTPTEKGGYLKGRLDGRTVLAHRVIFKMVYGYDPDQIDHDNRVGSDNRIDNLFDRSCRQNNRNRRMPDTNKSGVTGVCWDRNVRRWKAYVRGNDRKIIHLGYFDRIEDAATARCAGAREHGYHPNHGSPTSHVRGAVA